MPVWDNFSVEFYLRFPCFARQNPYSAEQGILIGQQGIFRADQVTSKRIPVGEATPLPIEMASTKPAMTQDSCLHQLASI
jgi:hypothetical protein